MMKPALVCNNLSRWYGEVQGLAGLNLNLGSGVYGLLGPNGSGKSTLMRLITGQIRPSRGSIEIFGELMKPGNQKLFRKIGYAIGEDIHFEAERAIDFLKLLATLNGASRNTAEKVAIEALRFMGMEEKGHVRLNQMSKGMRQRVKVAQAFLFEPDLVLLDEPLNGMDPVNRIKTIEKVREWGERGKTVLLASHVLHEVESVTDKLIMLHHGRLLAEGKLKDIRDLIDSKPRRATIQGEHLRDLIADLINKEIIIGFNQESEKCYQLDTENLDELLKYLREYGKKGYIQTLETDDQDLELVYDMLLSESN